MSFCMKGCTCQHFNRGDRRACHTRSAAWPRLLTLVMEHSLKLAAVGYQSLCTHEGHLLCAEEKDLGAELRLFHITAQSTPCRTSGYNKTSRVN